MHVPVMLLKRSYDFVTHSFSSMHSGSHERAKRKCMTPPGLEIVTTCTVASILDRAQHTKLPRGEKVKCLPV